MSALARSPVAVLGPLFAAACATFVGIGVARFSYGPLLPAMVQAGWLGPAAAGQLGAANFAGYLAGALLGPAVGRRFGVLRSLRGGMVMVALSMVPCAWPGGFLWFLPWRVLAGVLAGVLMVLVGPTVQAALPVRLRGLAGGFMFGGVGSGSVAGALIVPALLPHGLPATWLALAIAGLVFTAIAWPLWPPEAVAPVRAAGAPRWSRQWMALVACYALCGYAAAPHMQWWPDFVARGLGFGTRAGAHAWLFWGVSAAVAPLLLGRLSDRIGARRTMLAALVGQTAALALPLASQAPAALLASIILAGATAAGLSAVFLARVREVAGPRSTELWSICTSSYAASQTFAGFFLAWLFAGFGSHLLLFASGLLAILCAFPLVRR